MAEELYTDLYYGTPASQTLGIDLTGTDLQPHTAAVSDSHQKWSLISSELGSDLKVMLSGQGFLSLHPKDPSTILAVTSSPDGIRQYAPPHPSENVAKLITPLPCLTTVHTLVPTPSDLATI